MSAGAGQHKARADADQLTKSGRAQRKHTAQAQSAEHLGRSASRAQNPQTHNQTYTTRHIRSTAPKHAATKQMNFTFEITYYYITIGIGLALFAVEIG